MPDSMKIEDARVLRVLKSPRLQLTQKIDQEDLLALFKYVTNAVRVLILVLPDVEADEKAAVEIKNLSNQLQAALKNFPGRIGPPPPMMSVAWKSELDNWLEPRLPSPRMGNPGRPHRNALLLLCSFYRMAYGKEPSATGKPTRSFIQAWFQEFGTEMWLESESIKPPNQRQLSRNPWTPPNEEALTKALAKDVLHDFSVDNQLNSWLCDIRKFRTYKESSQSKKNKE